MKPSAFSAASVSRATIDGVNLFFSALLGANVGVMNDMPLNDYFKMILLLTGAVTAIFTMAVSERRSVFWSTGLAFAVILLGLGVAPPVPSDESRQDFHRLVVTMGVWLGMLLLLRFTTERSIKKGSAMSTRGDPP